MLKNAPKQGKKSAQLEKNNYPVGKIKFPSWKIDLFQLGVFRPSTGHFPKTTYKADFEGFVKKFQILIFRLSELQKKFENVLFLRKLLGDKTQTDVVYRGRWCVATATGTATCADADFHGAPTNNPLGA